MTLSSLLGFLVVGLMVWLALAFKPLRKAIGLLLVIVGAILSLSLIGLILGVPMILAGGLLMFFYFDCRVAGYRNLRNFTKLNRRPPCHYVLPVHTKRVCHGAAPS
jgi:hypothetical protein